MLSSSFAAKKLNASTFLVTEDDAYGEHPLIYVKIHLTVPVIIVGDTGCDRASKPKEHGKCFFFARGYLAEPCLWIIESSEGFIDKSCSHRFEASTDCYNSKIHASESLPRTVSSTMQQQYTFESRR
jgi:hypothetical protein